MDAIDDSTLKAMIDMEPHDGSRRDAMREYIRLRALASLVPILANEIAYLLKELSGHGELEHYVGAQEALAHARSLAQGGGDANGGLLDHAEYYLKEIAKLNVSGMRVTQGGDASGADERIADPPGENVAEFDSQTCETSAPPAPPIEQTRPDQAGGERAAVGKDEFASRTATVRTAPPADPDPIDAVIGALNSAKRTPSDFTPKVTAYEAGVNAGLEIATLYLDQHRADLRGNAALTARIAELENDPDVKALYLVAEKYGWTNLGMLSPAGCILARIAELEGEVQSLEWVKDALEKDHGLWGRLLAQHLERIGDLTALVGELLDKAKLVHLEDDGIRVCWFCDTELTEKHCTNPLCPAVRARAMMEKP